MAGRPSLGRTQNQVNESEVFMRVRISLVVLIKTEMSKVKLKDEESDIKLTAKEWEKLDTYLEGSKGKCDMWGYAELDGADEITDNISCCGIDEVVGLRRVSADKQLKTILNHMIQDRSFKRNQLLFTDTIKSSAWKETKEYAWRGPITKNSNTRHKVQAYIITPPRAVQMARDLGII